MDRCCRTCRHYYGGRCLNEEVLKQLQLENLIYQVSESGKLAAVLEEYLPWDPVEEEREFAELDEHISRLYEELDLQMSFRIRRDDVFSCSEWE